MKIEKTPLILVPALMTDARLYLHQIENLDDVADISVPVLSDYNSISEIASVILESAPEQFALAGVSMGGYVALEIMRQAPRRVTKLALINTKASLDNPEVLQKRENAIQFVNDENFIEMIAKAVSSYVLPSNNKDEKLTKLLIDMAKNIGIKGFINQQTAIKNRIDSTPFLKDIQAKTMIVCGRNDALLDDMKAMQPEIPRATFTIIEEAAHLSPIEQPIALTALLRYWLA